MTTSWVSVLYVGLLVLACDGWAANINVIYPRPPEPGEPVVYADSIDSTFILGHIEPVRGTLEINGFNVRYTPQGAFLAFLPLSHVAGTKQWTLTLTEGGDVEATGAVPYVFQSELPAPPDSSPNITFPRVIRVSEENAHTRTAPGGSYHLFPVKGTELLANAWENGFFEIRLSGNLTGFIERRFVALESDSALPTARIGDGVCRTVNDSCLYRFAISRPVPWSTEISADGLSLKLVLYDSRLAVDRFRYSPAGYLEEVSWAHGAGSVMLTLQHRRPLRRGFDISFADDSLTILIRAPYTKRQKSLKGKTVVVDAGHGGSAEGSIGPLGTREKDVTLRWAFLLAEELRRKGARPIMTRESDLDVALHDRLAVASSSGADIFVSLHANALPDGINPFGKHGTGTYFYQQLSHEAAKVLHKHMLKASGLADDGIYEANFAVIRPTAFPSVLLEAAYLMYPPEEELLRSDKYLGRLTKGVVSGLTEYFKREF